MAAKKVREARNGRRPAARYRIFPTSSDRLCGLSDALGAVILRTARLELGIHKQGVVGMTAAALERRITEVAEFIARYQGSRNQETQYAVEAARGTMAELERKLATLRWQNMAQ